MTNYITTPEEADHYSKELWDTIRSGVFKLRISSVYPFSAEGGPRGPEGADYAWRQDGWEDSAEDCRRVNIIYLKVRKAKPM